MPKLIRLTTSPIAFKYLLRGQMKFMQENGFEVVMISSDGPEVKDVLENEECRHIPVEMTRAITPLSDLKSISRLVSIFKKEKPDIVHSHTPKAGLLAMIASKIAGVPVRLHSNSGTPLATATGIKRTVFRTTEKLTAACSSFVLPNSKSLMDFLAATGVCSVSKMKMVGKGSTNGIDCNFFSEKNIPSDKIDELKNSISYAPGNFYFLFAGRIMTSKGIVELVESFTAINKRFPHAHLLVAGNVETHMDQVPADILSEINNHPCIWPLGWTEDIRIPMAVADCLVHPSHREGFPNVLLQAGALNLPVICSDCMGNVDIVTNGETGYIFPVGNRDRLTELMQAALTDLPALERVSGKLHQFVITNFSRRSVQASILELYRQLLNRVD